LVRARPHKIRFGKRGSLNVRFAPKAIGLLHRRKLQRWSRIGHAADAVAHDADKRSVNDDFERLPEV
jgi:hypothetical protein